MQWVRKKYGCLCRARRAESQRPEVLDLLVPVRSQIYAEEYLRRVDLACDFLGWQSKEAIEQLEVEMRTLPGVKFEAAAELRDVITASARSDAPPGTQKFARNFVPKINPRQEMEELQRVLGLAVLPSTLRV